MTQILSLVLIVGGLVTVGLLGNWWIAFGVFLMLWGNNISLHA